MRYGSVCSGVEAATVAWHPLGWEPQWFSEIEKFPSAVLQHHYPDVPNYGDMTKFKEWPDDRTIELLVGGTPCQSFSVAGLRRGLADPRGNLSLTYLALAAQHRPRWLVWENVPGVLSSNRGRDFGTFIGALGKLGYGFAYRVLDAQYFGVAQRRRRVFVVGHSGDWRRAAAVLFEQESLRGDPAPSREAREEVAGAIAASSFTGGAGGRPEGAAVNHFVTGALCARTGRAMSLQDAQQGHMIPQWPAEVASTLNAAFGSKQGLEDQHINGGAPLFVPVAFSSNMSTPDCRADGTTPTLKLGGQGGGNPPAVAYDMKQHHNPQPTQTMALTAGNCNTVRGDTPLLQTNMQVRRLTPRECERLQGFPDDYTKIKWRGKEAENCPDGPRYKAMGNSMAVPVMRWIGERIAMVDKL